MIDAFTAHRLRLPLVRPYRLAFGPVTHYDTIVVELALEDGRTGWGEATLLTGYTDETIDGSWTLVRELAPQLAGLDAAAYRRTTQRLAADAPFVASALAAALEHATGDARLAPTLEHATAGAQPVAPPARVPILALLQGDDEAQLADEFARLYADGYRTVKLKVGFDPVDDARHVAAAQHVVAGRAAIRVDANQGYDAAGAADFIAAVDPTGIELFEQPCAAGDWAAHAVAARAAAATGLPLMLDESIYGLADIERAAAERACSYLKVKLMKFPGLAALEAAIARIRALGMRPVLGNGVACDPSCWMEACIAARSIDNAGEMNGFQKAVAPLFVEPLAVVAGHIVLPERRPELDRRALATYGVDRIVQRQTRSACLSPSSPA